MRRAIVSVLAVAALAGGWHPGSAAAAPGQQAFFMDDPEIVYGSAATVERTMADLQALGVDRVRVSLFWNLLAPSPRSRERPSFSSAAADDPAAYPRDRWDRYDRIVASAAQHRLSVLFTVTGPAPLWATARGGREDLAATNEPNPKDYGDFVTAVGRRYSGSYRDSQPSPGQKPPPPNQIPIPLPDVPGITPLPPLIPGSPPPPPAPPAEGPLLPRVEGWSIWNEPNHPAWLTPQWVSAGGRLVPRSPALYRSLVDTAFAGLEATGHGSDLVLLGETAPRGWKRRGPVAAIRPLEFIRELYCVGRSYRPLAGATAETRGCPATADAQKAFPGQHPGLFRASGWAHHPYGFEAPPDRSDRVADNVPMANVSRLGRTLDRILGAYGDGRRLPIFLTEYGYQTNPPDPHIDIGWRKQADYINQSDRIAYRNPRVASTAQFLLVDDAPRSEFSPRDPRYWGTFQTGLITQQGKHKTSYLAYARPIDITPRRTVRRRTLRVLGQLRPAARGTALKVKLQYHRRGSKRWRDIRRTETRNIEGFVEFVLRAGSSGSYRLIWTDPASGKALPSRPVDIVVSARRR